MVTVNWTHLVSEFIYKVNAVDKPLDSKTYVHIQLLCPVLFSQSIHTSQNVVKSFKKVYGSLVSRANYIWLWCYRCYVISYCLIVTPQQMINLDNIIKLDHDTSSQLDRFDLVLKARNDYAKYIILWITAYQLYLTILDMLEPNSFGFAKYILSYLSTCMGKFHFLCDVLME
jgi:hypothetical protein